MQALYGILLIVGVIFLSGLIAYLGDQIGMRIGKKRISMFGLRPKYTSIVITILTGVLIATLTITIILATNNGVRQALFNIQLVYSRLADTRSELNKMNQEMLLKNLELEDKEKEIRKGEEELLQLQEQKELLEEENVLLEEQKDDLQKQLNNIEVEFEAAQEDIDFLTDTIENLNKTKISLEKQLSSLEVERQDLEDHIKILNQEINRVNQELSDTTIRYYTQDLVYQKGDVIFLDVIEKGDTQEEIVDKIADYLDQANEEVLKQPVRVARETGTALRLNIGEIAALTRVIMESESERFIVYLVANVNISQNSFVPVQFQINEDFVVFNKDDIIASKVIDAGGSVVEVEKELNELLEIISINSIKEGIISDGGLVGSIEFSSFYQLLNRIQNMDGAVEIKVLATDDIWREDGWNNEFSKKIKFEIESAGGINNG